MLAMIVIAIAALYFGRDIFVPLALAMLLSFALAPAVRWLRRVGIPNLAAVLSVVAFAFLVIFSLGAIVAWQVADLAEQLPTYRFNIEAKIDSLRQSPPGGHLFERATSMVRDLGRKIEEEDKQAAKEQAAPAASDEPKPLPVEIHRPAPTSMQIISTILGPLVSPLATAGIVIVFVIFLLLKREDLRDRLIRLAGARGLPRTTQALEDAAQRVGRYLLMQLVVNTTYAIPIVLGLWVIGIPNPVLWGLLCGLMRFVPYIGPIVAAFFPLALSIAVDPGWTTLLLTGALFIAVELVSNNLVEPWLYGASTGLSPLAIIAAAVFWTWLWGPVGLLLSTPLTVCLVVLGRHVPQFAFLDVLLGNEPALSPPELLYRRLLAGDPTEATERAEEYLREHSLEAFYDDVALPALRLAEFDRDELHLTEEQRLRVTESALALIDNLDEWEENGRSKAKSDDEDEPEEEEGDIPQLTDVPVLCAGARGNLDDAAAAALLQLLERRGANVRLLSYESLQTAALRELDLGRPAAIVLSYLNSDSLAHARFLVRRLRRRLPEARIIVALWSFEEEEAGRRDPLEATRADYVATSLKGAVARIAEAVALSPLDKNEPQTLAVQR
jgi:predicted PurR-regulated permease PerM